MDKRCPACGASLVGIPLHCTSCRWHLITLMEWKKLPPSSQGYALYAQAAWPTSELAKVENPYKEGSAKWKKFCEGEQRAVLDAQDGEE